jgi:hypothetical protein
MGFDFQPKRGKAAVRDRSNAGAKAPACLVMRVTSIALAKTTIAVEVLSLPALNPCLNVSSAA